MMTDAVAASTERNTQIALRLFEALDQQRFDDAASLLSPDFKLYFSNQVLGRDQMLALARGVYQSFADFRHEIHETLAIGDRVVIRCTDRGTHTGEFEGVAASGKPIAIGQISILRIAGEQVTEIREEADMLVLMQQIGALPTPAPASA
jgi:predicted ester cyclase